MDGSTSRTRGTGIRFIGNKQRLLPFIAEKVSATVRGHPGTFADLFAGTASVSRAFKGMGYRVIANDLLKSSEVLATAALKVSGEPAFARLMREEPLEPGTPSLIADPLDIVLSHLNELHGVEGFFFREYAPAASGARGVARQYFTDENARKIDAIRLTIRRWQQQGLIDPVERALLLSCLMMATNAVANVAGTYGFFLRRWYGRALEPLRLVRPQITPGREDHEIHREDANRLAGKLKADVFYLDPPYTKRQYSAYYHILETIAEDDEPEVWGLTGLRPRSEDGEWSSRYCYKKKAAETLRELVDVLEGKYVFLSYSSDGHIPHEQILEILGRRGPVDVWSAPFSRYKSNNGGAAREALEERLYRVECRN